MTSQTPVWFITASSSGFGKAIALEALKRHHRVIASARDTARIADLKDAGAHTLALDVTWPLERITEVAKDANEVYGRVDHLVNAAGYILVGAVEETSPEEDLATFQTNVLGSLNTLKAFLPYLRAPSSPPTHRTTSLFGSVASHTSGSGYALYSGTKHAISGVAAGLRPELAPLGIAVTVVEPGYFRTGFLAPTARVEAKKRLDAYEQTAGKTRGLMEETGGKQPGDVEKGARVVVDILLREGMAEGKEVPGRIVLGRDAQGVVRGKAEEMLSSLAEWEGVTAGTDHD